MKAQEACESMLLKYEKIVGDRYFRVQFKTDMVPLIYVKFVGAKSDSLPSELCAAKSSLQFILYGFNSDGTVKDEKVVASSPDAKHSNISGTLEHVMEEVSKVLEKYL